MKNLRRTEASEADTLRVISDYLDLLQAQGKLVYIRHQPPMMTSTMLRGKMKVIFKKVRQSQLGAPDLIVFSRTYVDIDGTMCHVPDVLCIEVKSATGKLSPAQERWAELAVAQGCRYIVARSLEDVRGEIG